jgi:hypothetical protein
MKVKGLIGTLAGLGLSLQGVTHAQPTLAHQAENLGGRGIESLESTPSCDLWVKNHGETTWVKTFEGKAQSEVGCVEMGRKTDLENLQNMGKMAPKLMVEYNGKKIPINPPEPKDKVPTEDLLYPVH